MKEVSEVVKITPMSSGPEYKKIIKIDNVIAAGGLLTFKNENLDYFIDNPMDEKRVKVIHSESTKRGHASLTTTPQFFFECEGSRVLDLYGSTFPFGSFIMFSSRRIEVTPDRLIRPKNLPESSWESYKPLLKIYKEMWDDGVKDKARKILPLGFYSRGIMKFCAEDILDILNDAENEASPYEIGLIANEMANYFEKKAPLLFNAAKERNISLSYGHPNIFNNKKFRPIKNMDYWKGQNFDEIVDEFTSDTKIDWKNFAFELKDSLFVQKTLKGSIAVWNEVKRHRTILQTAESVYSATDRAYDELNSLKTGEKPEGIHITSGAGQEYIDAVHGALQEYENLKDRGVKPRDAIYVVPHCVNLNFNVTLNGFHLVDPFGFFGVRECSTADYEVRELATKLRQEVEEKIPELSDGLMGPKCKTGVCPERNSCGIVEKYKKE